MQAHFDVHSYVTTMKADDAPIPDIYKQALDGTPDALLKELAIFAPGPSFCGLVFKYEAVVSYGFADVFGEGAKLVGVPYLTSVDLLLKVQERYPILFVDELTLNLAFIESFALSAHTEEHIAFKLAQADKINNVDRTLTEADGPPTVINPATGEAVVVVLPRARQAELEQGIKDGRLTIGDAAAFVSEHGTVVVDGTVHTVNDFLAEQQTEGSENNEL